MEQLEKFLNWFLSLGGQVPKEKENKVRSKFISNEEFHRRSFKDDPTGTKQRHNYVFNEGGRPQVVDKTLDNYPNVNNLKFDRK